MAKPNYQEMALDLYAVLLKWQMQDYVDINELEENAETIQTALAIGAPTIIFIIQLFTRRR